MTAPQPADGEREVAELVASLCAWFDGLPAELQTWMRWETEVTR